MKTEVVAALIVAAVVIVGALVFITAPSAQRNQAIVDGQVAEQVEKARRLIVLYDQQQAKIAAIQMRMGDLGFGPAIGTTQPAAADEQIDALVKRRSEAIAGIDEILGERAGQYSAARRKPPENLVSRISDIGYPPAAVQDNLRVPQLLAEADENYLKTLYGEQWRQHLPARPGGIGTTREEQRQALSQTIAELGKQLAGNAALLEEAERVLAKALGVTRGQAHGRDHLGANQLMGIVLHEQAGILWQQAMVTRSRAERLRSSVGQLYTRYAAADAERKGIMARRIDEAIEVAGESAAEAEANAAEARDEAERLQNTIDELKQKIADADARASSARKKMDKLEAERYDPTRPETFDQFAQGYREQAAIWRAASAEAQALKFGTLKNARLEDVLDLSKAKLVPVKADEPMTASWGLDSYERQVATWQAQLAGWQAAHAALAQQLEALKELKSAPQVGLESRAADLARVMQRHQDEALKAASESQVLVLEAEGIESQAVDKLAAAVKHLDRAERTADRRIKDAQQAKGAYAPDKVLPRLSFVIEDQTLVGQAKIQSGSALLLQAAIYLNRTRDLKSHAATMGRAQEMGIAQVDVPGEKESLSVEGIIAAVENSIDEARTAAIEKAQDALSRFEAAARPLKSHWTVQANVATAHYLLALLAPDESQQREYRQSAIESYNSVIEGRESSPYVVDHVKMLERLQAVGG